MMTHYSKKIIITQTFWGMLFFIFIGISVKSFILEEGNFILSQSDIVIILGYLGISLILSIIYAILYYKSSGYIFEKTQIVVIRGVLFKQKKCLAYEKMNSIDYSQGILQRILHIKTLKVDSGSTTAADFAEIMIIDDINKMADIEAMIRSKIGAKIQDSQASNNNLENKPMFFYKFDKVIKMIYFLFLFARCLVVVFGLVLFAFLAIILLFKANASQMILGFIFIAGFSSVLIFVTTAISIFFSQYNYIVTKNDKYLIIDRGLLVKTHSTLPLNRIKAINVQQSIIQRIFKYASIKLEMVGFGESDRVTNNVFPLVKKSEVNDYLKTIDSKYVIKDYEHQVSKKSFRFFIFLPLIILVPLILLISLSVTLCLQNYYFEIIVSTIGVLLLVVGWILIRGFLALNNNKLSFQQQALSLSNGVFIKKEILINKEAIIGIEKIDTLSRMKKHVCSYVIHYYNNAYKNTERVNMLSNDIFAKLSDFLIK